MPTNSIPEWNENGCLPISIERITFSPYETTSDAFVKKYATTRKRRDLLKGWLEYRRLLQPYVAAGFQWIDGSFVENVEDKRKCPPNDIDLVDFVIFSKELTSSQYKNFGKQNHTDNYSVPLYSKEKLSSLSQEDLLKWYNFLIGKIAEWNRMWGHSQDDEPKGFLKIPYSVEDDQKALEILHSYEAY